MLSAMVGFGRQTVTGMLCASGRQFTDWSAAYRLFSHDRWDATEIRRVIRREVLSELPAEAPFVGILDDTLLRKSGTHVPGTSWRRDPLGPKFKTNLIRAQRFFQISAALPIADTPSAARVIPLEFIHAPTPAKPKRDAPSQAWDAYRRLQKKQRLGVVAVERLKSLRADLDSDGASRRPLWCAGDGGYTNETVLKHLPERTVFIGRIRSDAQLYYLPDGQMPRGRKRVYGKQAPTPEQLRQDDAIAYQTVRVWATGRMHDFKVKTIGPVRWRKAGEHHALRLVVVAPLSYSLRKGSRILYRKPAFLICTDPSLPVEKVLQTYVWRSGIEVNFRDQKQIIGVGQAQVRNNLSVERIPSFLTSGYALLLLAAVRALGKAGFHDTLPPPKWQTRTSLPLQTTSSLIQRLREELWGRALGLHFSGFPSFSHSHAKTQKSYPCLTSAVLYMKK